MSKVGRKRDKQTLTHIQKLQQEPIVDQERQIRAGKFLLCTTGKKSLMVLWVKGVSFENNEVFGDHYEEKFNDKLGRWVFHHLIKEKDMEAKCTHVVAEVPEPTECRISSTRVVFDFPLDPKKL